MKIHGEDVQPFTEVNPRHYKPGVIHQQVELKVIVMLDACPGAWHHPQDIMRYIAEHNYVQSVELVGVVDANRV
jgi:hypothetical protein